MATISPLKAYQETEDERLLKAAFVFNFTKFSSWPESVQAGAGKPLTLCTMGKDKLITELRQLDGRPIKGSRIRVVPIKGREGDEACHLIYIAGSQGNVYRHTLEALRGKPILTVSQIPGFARAGGMIEIFHRQDKIRFSINLAAAREAGVAFSSRLLDLAEVVGMEESR